MSLLENPLLKKVEENGGPFGRGQGPRGEQNFVPFFSRSNEKGEIETKPKKTRKMRKRSGGGSRHRTGAPFGPP